MGRKLGISNDPAVRVAQWEQDGSISFKRAEKLAEKTHTPFGYLFLPEPPEDRLPVADFRTLGSLAQGASPSTELMDVLFDALRKQAWFRDHLIELGSPRLEFVGKARIEDAPESLADRIRVAFKLGSEMRAEAKGWESALSRIFERLEDQGILVLRSGVAGNNTHRPLSVQEFRGFALSDPYAPVLFINSQDSAAGQMFTVMHELVHLWLGLSGVSNPAPVEHPGKRVELFCNSVAAELLVPKAELLNRHTRAEASEDPIRTLCAHFKVSSLVILRRLHDLGLMDWNTYRALYQKEERSFRDRKERLAEKGGGNYYATQQARVGRRFARALIASTIEGHTPYSEAFSLLGVRKSVTFEELARTLGFSSAR